MATDTYDMSDEALDAVLENTVTDNSEAGYSEIGSESGNSEDADVSPSDDIDAGQSEEEEEATHVDESSESNEDPEDSLSTDEDDDDDEYEESDEDHEPSDDNSEDSEEADLEADEEPVAFQSLRADGKEYPIESMQELYSLASKGINADRKWNDSAEGRRLASTLKKNGLTGDDINMLVELKKGNRDAIASLLKGAEIDPMDIDVDALDGNYRPQNHSTDDFEMQLDDVITKVKNQPRYEESVSVIMDSWDKQSKDSFYKNPQILELLNVDMQVGADGTSMYDKVSPIAEKMKALETGVKRSDLEYYQMAGAKVLGMMQQSFESKQEAEGRKQAGAQTKRKVISKKKKAAASSRGSSGGGTPQKDVVDMSDEELDKLLEETS